MKKLFTLLTAVTIVVHTFAQAPEKFSYQAIIRDNNGQLVTNQPIGIRISILQGNSTGAIVYEETIKPNPQTNEYGLVSIEIGTGAAISGSFSEINWINGPYFLETETDPAGGTNYTITGISQLLSVPYALYAKKAGNGFSGNYTDLINKPDWVDSINNTAVLLKNNQTIAGVKTFSDSIIGNVTGSITGTINANHTVVVQVAFPIVGSDAANKVYVDSLLKMLGLLPNNYAGIVKDAEGNLYKTVKIGIQTWMAENLRTSKYNDATAIPLVADDSAWINDKTGAYCWYNNDVAFKYPYGALYNWYAVNTGKLCPTDWHVATDAEWSILINYLG